MDKYPERFIERYGSILDPSSFKVFLDSLEEPLKKSLRVNTILYGAQDLKDQSKKNGWVINSIPWIKEGFFIDRDNKDLPLGNTVLHLSGKIYIQESISMLPSIILNPKEGDLVLDMASSPGSKTTHMAMMMNNKGMILANDLSSKRIRGLISNLKRLCVCNTSVVRKNGIIFGRNFPNTFDKILLDAPCTGDGLIRKDRKVLDIWNEYNIKQMSKLQKTLIDSAFKSLRPGGSMVYSTCTLSPEEDEEVISYLVEQYKDIVEIQDLSKLLKGFGYKEDKLLSLQGITSFENKKYSKEVKKTLRVWPHIFNTEGFFIAKIKKLRKTLYGSMDTKKPKYFSIKIFLNKERKRLETYIKKYFGYIIKFEKKYEIVKINNDIIIRSSFAERFFGKIKIEYTGLCIFKEGKQKFVITHEGVMLLGEHFTKRVIEITTSQKNDYYSGKDIYIKEDLDPGTVVLKYDGIIIGKGLLKDKKIKNQLPREYIIK